MGARLVKFEFSPKENEQIEAIVKVPEEKRSVIHGVVTNCRNVPVKDAVVKLFEKIKTPLGTKLRPITHTFTDNCGEFLFGPLQPNKEYTLKVWYHDIKVRKIKFSDYDDCSSSDYCEETPDTDYNDCDDNIDNGDCECHSDSNNCNDEEEDNCNYQYEDDDECYDYKNNHNNDCDDEDDDRNHNHHSHHHYDDDNKDDCDCPAKEHTSSHHSDDDD